MQEASELKRIGLGTAMWGWNVDKNLALDFLDKYYDSGGRWIDTAYNYPLNGLANSAQLSINLIASWVKRNNIDDLKVIFKLGSLSNKNSPKQDLSSEHIRKMAELAANFFGANLASLMIHWDNRESYDEIFDTLSELKTQCLKQNVRLGLSGIKHHRLYSRIIKILDIQDVDYQIKYPFLQQHPEQKISIAEEDVKDFRLWAYGISGSGLKLDVKEYRSDSYVNLVRSKDYHAEVFDEKQRQEICRFIKQSKLVGNLYEYSMLAKELAPDVYGYLVSPSNMQQLEEVLLFRKKLSNLRTGGRKESANEL